MSASCKSGRRCVTRAFAAWKPKSCSEAEEVQTSVRYPMGTSIRWGCFHLGQGLAQLTSTQGPGWRSFQSTYSFLLLNSKANHMVGLKSLSKGLRNTTTLETHVVLKKKCIVSSCYQLASEARWCCNHAFCWVWTCQRVKSTKSLREGRKRRETYYRLIPIRIRKIHRLKAKPKKTY